MFNIFKVNKKYSFLALIVCIFLPQLVGLFSSFLIMDEMQRFQDLIKPSFTPPAWVFAPVWTILFLLMGVASYRIWMIRKENQKAKHALFLYVLQLLFNFFWPILFWGLALRGIAFVEIIVLLSLIVLTAMKFYRLDKIAGYLMIPYILWVAFASVLNFSIFLLNR